MGDAFQTIGPATERPEGTVFHCGLCGTAFTHGGVVCGSCPMNAGCDLVKCPHCGYQFPRGSRILDLGRRVVRWIRGGRA